MKISSIEVTIKLWRRKYLLSVAAALGLTVLAGLIANLPYAEAAAFLLLPGIFAAALFFPGGIHSDSPNTFFILVAILNIFILSWPILGLWALIENRLQRNRGTDGPK